MPGAFEFALRDVVGFLLVSVQNPHCRTIIVGVEESGVAALAYAYGEKIFFALHLLSPRTFKPPVTVEHETYTAVLRALLIRKKGAEFMALVCFDNVFHGSRPDIVSFMVHGVKVAPEIPNG